MRVCVICESPDGERTVSVTDTYGSLPDAAAAIQEPGDEIHRDPEAIVINQAKGGAVMLLDAEAFERRTGTPVESASSGALALGAGRALAPPPPRVAVEHLRRSLAAGVAPLLLPDAYRDIVAEAGGRDEANRLLAKLATEHQLPIVVNLRNPDSSAYALTFGPQGWSEDQLQAWLVRAGIPGQPESFSGTPPSPELGRKERRQQGRERK